MNLFIPNKDINIELINKLPTLPNTYDLYENFFVKKDKENTIIVSDRLNSLSLLLLLIDYTDEQLIIAALNYIYGEAFIDFQSKKRFNAENIKYISPILDFLINKKLILKVYNEELVNSGVASSNYVYVIPSLEKFSFDQTNELCLEYINIVSSQVTECYNEQRNRKLNGFEQNELKKEYKETIKYMGELLKELYYFDKDYPFILCT